MSLSTSDGCSPHDLTLIPRRRNQRVVPVGASDWWWCAWTTLTGCGALRMEGVAPTELDAFMAVAHFHDVDVYGIDAAGEWGKLN